MTQTTVDPLAYYAAHGCALFPIPAGSKAPVGIVRSFKHDYSTDPAQWAAWRTEHPNCNFGVVAFASRLIIADIDTKEGRDQAWALWVELCAEWGLPAPVMPHVQSARGGWHCYFTVPDDVDPATLRQPDAVKKIINLRCVGFTVAAGSTFVQDGVALPYILLTDADPYPAPAALVEFCKRKANPRPNSGTALPGSRDRGDVAGLLTWLNERGGFSAYEDWVAIGMALKIEYADSGFELWELTFDETVTPETAANKWESFATDPNGNSVTLNTFLDRAHKLGWRGQVRRSTASMFDGVAQIAAAAGATLAGGAQPIPMLSGQEELTRIATPRLQGFLDDTSDAPSSVPNAADLPTLPPQMSGHGLFDLMSACIVRIFALTELKPWKAGRINTPMAILHQMHADVYESVRRRLNDKGFRTEDRKTKNESAGIQEQVERITVTHDKWEYDQRTGQIESDNPDNVIVLLGVCALELRWNSWLAQMEIIGGGPGAELYFPEWTYVDDAIVAALMTRAKRSKTRFRPGKDFLWETLLTLARANSVDPVIDTLDALADAWDRQPRLITWLARYCGTPCDTYHQAVGKLIIGGMVKRARNPGCKFDFMPIFYGPQGTGKSSLLKIMAFRPEWFTDSILLGDASKELVLSLAGKLVVEISEMGMRGNTNANHVKAMITRENDEGRTAYARSVSKRPRRNIFCGTTNDESPLEDPTGNRRFLPIRIVSEIDLVALRQDIGQLIGEAAALNFDPDLPREVWAVAAQHQEFARAASDLEVMFNDWFAETEFAKTCFVTQPDTVRLCGALGRKNAGTVVQPIMKRLGFRLLHPRINGKYTWCWVRGPNMLPRHVPALPRYEIDVTANNNPRVVLRSPVQGGGSPPPLAGR